MYRYPFGREFHGSLEGAFGRLRPAAFHLQEPEVRIGGTTQGIDTDGLLDFGNRLVDVSQPGERVAQKDLRVDVLRFHGQDGFGPGFGFVEAARAQQVVSRSDLDRSVIRQQICGANVFRESAGSSPSFS